MSKPLFSFIFVNYRSVEELEKALESITPLGSEEVLESIIVNNDVLESQKVEELGEKHRACVKQTGKNLGFASANNLGAAMAGGEILFFMNPDARYLSGSLLGLASLFRYRPRSIFGTALVKESGEREAWSSGTLPSLPVLILNNLFPRYVIKTWLTKTVTEAGWVSGAALAIRKDFFQEIGSFDDSFFLYFEDVDLAHRAQLKGGFVGVTPFFKLRHTGGQSHESRTRMKSSFLDGQKKYYSKWRPRYETATLALFQGFLRLIA